MEITDLKVGQVVKHSDGFTGKIIKIVGDTRWADVVIDVISKGNSNISVGTEYKALAEYIDYIVEPEPAHKMTIEVETNLGDVLEELNDIESQIKSIHVEAEFLAETLAGIEKEESVFKCDIQGTFKEVGSEMKVITVAGMISAGKSTLTELISEKYDSLAKYEQIPEILSKWYGDARVVTDGERIPFLTQLTFLNSRMNMLRSCMTDERSGFAVLDRSIYEDKLFAQIAWEDGGISDSEWEVYCSLLDTMWAELNMIPKKAPDLTIYIRISFETFMERLLKRGRDIEVNNLEANKDYFYKLWSRYDDFMFNQYTQSRVLVIDGDKLDFVENATDREIVLSMIHTALIEEGVIESAKPMGFPQWVVDKKVRIKAGWYLEKGYTEGTVVEAFKANDGQFILNCRVEGRKNQLTLYGKDQYELLEEYPYEI
jgi:deoxyadenosine/deoxycytidine kinase